MTSILGMVRVFLQFCPFLSGSQLSKQLLNPLSLGFALTLPTIKWKDKNFYHTWEETGIVTHGD